MARYGSSGFELGNVLDRRAYPTARRNRSGPPSGGAVSADPSAPPAPAPPTTRNVNFLIEVGVNTRSTRSFGPLRGPGIVDRVVVVAATIAANNDFAFFPGYNDGPKEESLVASTTPVNWPTWFNRMPQQGADYNPATRGIVNAVGLTQKINWDMPVKGVVPLSQWWLTMSVVETAGVALANWHGYVVVLEGVDPYALALYTG